MLNDEERKIIGYLDENYGCHTVLLYGSRALGTNRPDSDWDILALNRGHIREIAHTVLVGVGEINAYIYSQNMVAFNSRQTSPLYGEMNEFVRLRHAKVLAQELDWGTQIIRTANAIYQHGPLSLQESDLIHMYHYLGKTLLSAVTNETAEAGYRNISMHRLLFYSFRFYFSTRRLWIPSEKDGMEHIRVHDRDIYEQFLACESKPYNARTILRLIDMVFRKPINQ